MFSVWDYRASCLCRHSTGPAEMRAFRKGERGTVIMKRILRILVLASLALVLSLGIAPAISKANGAPVRIILVYLEGVSNWGPKKAAGIMEIVRQEGGIHLTVTGLQRLPNNETYEIWLHNSLTDASLSCGRFNVDNNGDSDYYNMVSPSSLAPDYDQVLLTVDDASSWYLPTSPRVWISIVGFIPEI